MYLPAVQKFNEIIEQMENIEVIDNENWQLFESAVQIYIWYPQVLRVENEIENLLEKIYLLIAKAVSFNITSSFIQHNIDIENLRTVIS